MKEQFYNEFLARMSGKISDDAMQVIAQELCLALDNYDVTKKSTEVAVYNFAPECLKTYLVVRKIEGIKKSTLQLYALRLRQFFEMTQLPIEKIKANDVRVWLYNLQNQSSKGMSNRTLDNTRTIICTFFKWANAEGYIPTNPCATIKPIKYSRKERSFLNEDELEAIRNICTNVRDAAIVEFLYSTGCRVSELINVKISDVDFENNEVTLFGKGEKYRQSYLNAKSRLALKIYLGTRTDDSPYLFVKQRTFEDMKLSKSFIEKMIAKLGVMAGINRKVFPHLIRHTTATIGLQRGMDITEIQKMLGHASIETTMVYAKTSKSSVKASHQKYIV